ncbi:nuclear transport factor 2 family protein [Paenibacillus sp. IHB B 3415]|uniref:nuclear transport factor 2 family protein n=1 Tax=Paenibacillus sp. IHB B 3415 TaxID=867080 RepID=UPI00190FE5BB|nr:nuclear transport factor 2 family protein [Paenibacillus sp. IHB B 3415]
MMIERERVIENYFESWINKNNVILRNTFNPNIVYSECYGPEYHGIDTIESWFDDWNKRGTVLVWNIKQFIHQGNLTAVEWYFKCDYDAEVVEFDGVSLIEFNNDNLVVNLKEFQSKIPHYYPYK